MKKIKTHLKNFTDSNEGVVGIIVAILLIGLFVSAIAVVQSVYIPKWMEQIEAEHMDEVANQFSQLKFSVDTLSVTSHEYSQISSPITLGSKEMPFLQSARAYGTLDILPNGCKIIITDKNTYSDSYILGSLKYTSSNAYYIDQSIIYENGALILSQHLGDIVSVRPAFSVDDNGDLNFNIFRFSGLGEKTSITGYGTYPIQTKFSSSKTSNVFNIEHITIYTSYTNAWRIFFNDTLSNSALNFSINNTEDDNGITITFYATDEAYLPELLLNVYEIEIQISPGWIE